MILDFGMDIVSIQGAICPVTPSNSLVGSANPNVQDLCESHFPVVL